MAAILKFIKQAVFTLIGPALILLLWLHLAKVIDNRLILPQFTSVAIHFVHPLSSLIGLGSLAINIFISLIRVFIGYAIAALLAVPIGVLMGYNAGAYALVNPVLSLFRPIPPISWVPLVLAWFGVTSLASIIGLTQGPWYVYLNNFKVSMTFIIFLGAFFPIVTSSIHGVSTVPRQLVESARVLGADEWFVFRKILLPAAGPTIVNGLRTGLGVAWTCLVSAEMLPGSLSGIGYMIMHAYEIARVDVVMTGMISIGVTGSLLDYFFRIAERKWFSWKR